MSHCPPCTFDRTRKTHSRFSVDSERASFFLRLLSPLVVAATSWFSSFLYILFFSFAWNDYRWQRCRLCFTRQPLELPSNLKRGHGGIESREIFVLAAAPTDAGLLQSVELLGELIFERRQRHSGIWWHRPPPPSTTPPTTLKPGAQGVPCAPGASPSPTLSCSLPFHLTYTRVSLPPSLSFLSVVFNPSTPKAMSSKTRYYQKSLEIIMPLSFRHQHDK